MASETPSGDMELYSTATFITDHGLNHFQLGIPMRVIEKSGRLVVRLYRPIPDGDTNSVPFRRADSQLTRGVVVAQFLVSSSQLRESSAAFEDEYVENGWSNADLCYIDLEYSDPTPVEIILRAFHESYVVESYSATLAMVEQIDELLSALEVPKSKLKFWFFEWLATKEIRHVSLLNDNQGEALDRFLQLCYDFKHMFALRSANDIMNVTGIPKSLLEFPPVLRPSLRQLSEIILLNRKVNNSAYASLGFSAKFIHLYGAPTEYWSDYYNLMMTDNLFRLLPTNRGTQSAWEKLRRTTFLNFANSIDDKVKASRGKEKTVWRKEMEGLWVQHAVKSYEDEVERRRNDFDSKSTVRQGLQCDLKKIIGKRFHPMSRVEPYWAKKGDGKPCELWQKEVARDEEISEMVFAKPDEGQQEIDMDALFQMMGNLQLRAADASVDLTAEEAMQEIKARHI